jgi:hypothetical protein
MKRIHLFDSEEAKILWKKSDDGIKRICYLSEIYNNVPKELKHVYIKIMELHKIEANKKIKEKVIKWLSKD